MHDLILRGGTLVDGTGSAPREADVAVSEGRIRAVGHDLGAARETIDARGKLVLPGHRRHPHPLRRPGDLGLAALAVVLARRHDDRDGQLRRRLRAGAPG
jgi:predicted amidohydrolase YtcJ